MADINTVSTPQSGGTNPYEGVSNPPTTPITIQDENTPTPTGAGPSPSASQNQTQPQPAQTGSSPTSQSGSGPGQQPQGPQNAGQNAQQGAQGASAQGQATGLPGKAPTPPKQGSVASTPQPAPPSQHPAVARAGIMNQVASALVGPRGYTYNMDANTGTITKTPKPLSSADIGMAIALEAISGALTGLSQSGPNANARGAALAFAQGQQQAQQQDQQARQQASEDYTRKVQIFENNLRMRNSALQIGKLDYDQNQAYVNEYADTAARIMKDHPEQVEAVASYADFAKYDATIHNAIPYKVVPRLENGKQAIGPNGEPLWDINYLILKPNFLTGTSFTDKDKAAAKEMNLPWATNSTLDNAELNYITQAGLKSKIANYQLGKQAILDAQQTLNTLSQSAKLNDPATLTDVPIKFPVTANAITAAVPAAADKYGVSPDLLMKLAKAVAVTESNGDPNVKDSPKGAIGPMQLMPDTATTLGVDPRNPVANTTGGVTLLAQLLQQFKDPKLALAAYNAGPEKVLNGQVPNIPETQNYVSKISGLLGITDEGSETAGDTKLGGEDWAKLNKDNPTLADAVDKFQAAYANASGSLYAALNHMINNGQSDAANLITSNFLGGDLANAQKVDQKKQLDMESAKQRQEDDERIRTKNLEADDTDRRNAAKADIWDKYLQYPTNYAGPPQDILQMSIPQAEEALRAQGVAIPPAFASLFKVAKSDMSMTDYSSKVYNNGKQNELDSQHAGSYIAQFLNPGYQEGDYARINKLRTEAASSQSDIGKNMQSVGTALMHMRELDSIADSSDKNYQLNVLNKLAIEYGKQTGNNPDAVLRAIAPRVAEEMVRAGVASAGKPYEDQVQQVTESLGDSLSKGQLHSVLQANRSLIYDKFSTLDEQYAAQTNGEHLKLSPRVSAEFRRNGFETPWDQTNPGSQPNQQNQQNVQGRNQGQSQGQNQNQNPPQRVIPKGAFPAYRNGVIVGYSTDGTANTYHAF